MNTGAQSLMEGIDFILAKKIPFCFGDNKTRPGDMGRKPMHMTNNKIEFTGAQSNPPKTKEENEAARKARWAKYLETHPEQAAENLPENVELQSIELQSPTDEETEKPENYPNNEPKESEITLDKA